MPADDLRTLGDADIEAILSNGDLEIEGRLVTASNASFRGWATLDGVSLQCVYKPVQGERPLWDFPDGTLAGRERAARIVSETAGWDVVPPTILRDGAFGFGMCQKWIDGDDHDLVDVVDIGFRDPGWIPVLEAEDQLGRPVLLVHQDHPRLRDMAVFDVVVNNADRKGGHVLLDDDGSLWGCDHGVSFHTEVKLRTVLWGWADESLRDVDRERLDVLLDALLGGLADDLEPHLTGAERNALTRRVQALLRTDTMPNPHGRWPSVPWPAF
ncbi:MAG TPA: SCO1664 family protein [Nocardioidaceae bacterium]|nr:SCO1664 family protein [Nocardioidaceae bacterium]